MPIEFAERIRRIPVYPAADGYALPGDVALLASNESPYPPIPAVIDAIARVAERAEPLPGPDERRAAQGAERPDRRARRADRDRQRVLRHPARRRRGAARAGRRARLRVAELQRLPAPRRGLGRARDPGPGRRRRTRTTSTRCSREITAATRLVLVCNPNNPTSTALPLEEIAAFVRAVPRHIAVILDEAYCEFNLLQDPDESIALLDRHPNLVLLRTFSKVYGLCGLRVGYGLCGSEAFRNAVDQVRQPFYCNAAAQAAAVEALKHQDEVTRRVERNLAERMDLADGLRGLGLAPAESQANFVWFDLPDAEAERDVDRRPRPARRARARRRVARPPRRAPRHGRDRGREREVRRRARRARRLSARVASHAGSLAPCARVRVALAA